MLVVGDCTVDLAAREVRRDGVLVPLEPRAFDVLAALIIHRDRVVPKPELIEQVWGGPFVSESALTTCIKAARKALGDDGARQSVIRNERGRGYRFVAEVGAPAPDWGSRLVGRSDDVDAVLGRLAPRVVVTLTGPGGVGKTTLADAVAAAVAPQFPDGVWRADLSSASIAEEVNGAVALAARSDGPVAEIAGSLAPLRGLLLLDNCEHVVAHVARLVDRLHEPAAASITVLATSRERLGVWSERVHPVLPLSDEAARLLFRERVAAVGPALDAASLDPDGVELMLSVLDRLPLAIEMAAARLASMSFEDLLASLTEGHDVLRSPRRDGPGRHRSLATLVEWSTSQLAPEHLATLARLQVFAGAFTHDAASTVLGGSPGAVQLALSELVDRSLLQVDLGSPVRYRMLETVRGTLVDEVAAAPSAAHAAWVVDVLQRADADLRTAREVHGAAELDAMADELRAAHRWARDQDLAVASQLTAAAQLYAYTRLWAEPAVWAEYLAQQLDDDDPARAIVDVARAAQAAHAGQLASAAALADAALRLSEATGDRRAHAAALEVRCDVALYGGDLDAVRLDSRRLAALGDELGDLHLVTNALVVDVMALLYGGDRPAAATALERVRGPGAEVPMHDLAPSDRAWIAYTCAEVLAGEDPDAALAALAEAIELAEGVGHRYAGSVARTSLLALRARGEDLGAALADAVDVLVDCRRHGNHAHALTLLRNLVGLLVRVDRTEDAVRILAAIDGVEKPTYGEERARLDESTDTLRRQVGHTQFDRWWNQGAGRGVGWALERAIDATRTAAVG